MGRLRAATAYAEVVCSAVLMWAAFPDIGFWPLVFPALALLVAATDGVSVGRATWLAFLWGALFFALHLTWAIVAVEGSVGPWIMLTLAQAVFIGLWGAFFGATRGWQLCRTWWGEALIAAALWVGIEQLRARVPFGGFPWAKIAYSQVDSPLITFAPLGGEALVTFIVVFLAVLLRFIASAKDRATSTQRLLMVGIVVAAVLLPVLIKLPTAQQNGSVRVGVVQGNVQTPQRETFSIEGKVARNHLEETERMLDANSGIELVLWGENSLDRDPTASALVEDIVLEASQIAEVPLLAGFNEYVGDVRYNWMAVWYPNTGLDQVRYGKQLPVPWGEYVPFRTISEWFAPEAAQISVDMLPVDNPGYLPVTLNDGRVIPLALGICFEAAAEPVFSEGIQLGGQLIVIPTNNAQFVDSAESTQQLQMARFRAAEFSRAAVQVSTNGVSALIRPDGAIVGITERQVAANLVGSLPLRTILTPAAVAAEPLARAAIAFTLGFGAVSLLFAAVRALKKRR